MASDVVEVNWYEERVLLEVDRAVKQSLAQIAAQIEQETKINIREQPVGDHTGLIDTGFYINSVYFVTEDDSTYDQTDPSGVYTDREGNQVERYIAPEADLGDAAALVAIGAEYAVYLEMKYSPLFRAVESVAGKINGLIKRLPK